MYTEAKAGLFSSVLSNQAYAISSPTQPNNNSQTMPLLQANISSLPILNTKNDKTTNIDESKNINIVSENALLATTSPLGASNGGDDGVDPSFTQTSVYVVRKGDSLPAIAKMFEVSVNTILWANDMKKGDAIHEGDVLFILPISGLEHTVTKGQTLKSIAALYKADINDIIQYNDITLDTQLAIGDKLIIPDAEKAEENDKPIKNLAASVAKDKQYYVVHPTKDLSGYYVNPVPGYRKSQGIHDGNAVDLARPSGSPIYASAAGTVIKVVTGCTVGVSRCGGGFGNVVVIQHPNGTKTLYAHQSSVVTQTDAHVDQGELIGYVGSTGRSTGPHLHFEVIGARNPGADGSWAN